MSAKHSTPARIVVVEDNSADVFLLRHALDQQGQAYVLDVISDGEEAIEFANGERTLGSSSEPCVIVLDMHLPKHDGAAVLKTIKQSSALATVHVVALTTMASPKDEKEVRDLGVSLYRAKPSLLEEWVKLAGQILQLCREPAPVLV
jgi:CheY-like chemotaxis protein